MPLTNVSNDPAAKTITLTAELAAPVDRAWQLFADPRQLEQWWNPPGYPLTITDHDLSVGGMVQARVNGPDGQTARPYWRITAVDPPRSMVWEDGFLDEELQPDPAIPPSTMHLTLADRHGGGTLMTIVVAFPSTDDMQAYIDMDGAEQMRVTVDQADALLAA